MWISVATSDLWFEDLVDDVRAEWATEPAVEVFHRGSVYVDPSATGVIDQDRARRLIGDRLILLAVFPEHEDLYGDDLCEQIVEEHPDTVAAVYEDVPDPSLSGCVGEDYRPPGGVEPDEWMGLIVHGAGYAAELRMPSRDRTVEVEEFVLAVEHGVAMAEFRELPKREVTENPHAWWWVALALCGVAGAVVALFVATRWAARRLARWRQRRAERMERAAQLRQYLSATGSAISRLDPGDSTAAASALAAAARHYVDAMAALERGDDLAAAGEALSHARSEAELARDAAR